MSKPAGQSGGQYAKKKSIRLVAAQPLQENQLKFAENSRHCGCIDKQLRPNRSKIAGDPSIATREAQ
jgi:hypothetical protein